MTTSVQPLGSEFDSGSSCHEDNFVQVQSANPYMQPIQEDQIYNQRAWRYSDDHLTPHDIDPRIYLQAEDKNSIENVIVGCHLRADLVQKPFGESSFSKWSYFPSASEVVSKEMDWTTVGSCFPNLRSAEAYVKALIQQARKPGSDILRTREQERALVGILKQAFQSTAISVDPLDILEAFNLSVYDPRIVEYHCWKLLHAIIDRAQSNISIAGVYGKIVKNCIHKYEGFIELFDSTRYALQVRKSLCLYILECPKIIELADDPLGIVNNSHDSQSLADQGRGDTSNEKENDVAGGLLETSRQRNKRSHAHIIASPTELEESSPKKRKLSQASHASVSHFEPTKFRRSRTERSVDPILGMPTVHLWQQSATQNDFDQAFPICFETDDIHGKYSPTTSLQSSEDNVTLQSPGSMVQELNDPNLHQWIQKAAGSSTSTLDPTTDSWLPYTDNSVSGPSESPVPEQALLQALFDGESESPIITSINHIDPSALRLNRSSAAPCDSRIQSLYTIEEPRTSGTASNTVHDTYCSATREQDSASLDPERIANTDPTWTHEHLPIFCDDCWNLRHCQCLDF